MNKLLNWFKTTSAIALIAIFGALIFTIGFWIKLPLSNADLMMVVGALCLFISLVTALDNTA